MRRPTLFIILSLLLVMLSSPAQVYSAAEPAGASSSGVHRQSLREISIDFDNVDILLFIKYMSELTGKNFIVDKEVKGKVTIISPRKISEKEAYRVFESVLEVHGFTTVPAGPVIKIVPSAVARTQNIATLRMGHAAGPEDKVVTQLIPLKYTSPDEIKRALAPLIAKTSVMIANTQSGMLIVTDTLSNIHRLLSIIKALDVPSPREQVAVIPLKNASAADIAKVVDTIFQQAAAGKKSAGGWHDITRIVPYERINALVVLASDTDMERIRNLVAMLDTEKEKGGGDLHVYTLQNADAKNLAKVLNKLPQDQMAGGAKDNAKGNGAEIRITADEATNSLIVNASPEQYANLEPVIKKLDIPRRMVYLEALIMEVKASKTFSVGAQWITSDGKNFGGFSNSSSNYGIINGITASSPSLPAGGTLGIFKEGITVGGVTFPNLAAVINAYKDDSDVNILETPQVLTLDNKKAEISVGENVPYITSKNTTTGEQQDYTNYEYKDVATKLSIVPHINQTGALRLEIKTEVIKLSNASASSESLTPTTLKRTADTTVVVSNNETVVIGGIIQNDETTDDYKVPGLGDIPVLGWLFRTHSTDGEKTNMFIFITPHIINNPSDIKQVTRSKESESGRTVSQARKSLVTPEEQAQAMKISEQGYDEMQKNRIAQAKTDFLASLRLDPENPYALINLAVIYEKEGRITQAVAAYRRVVRSGTKRIAAGSSDPKKVGEPLVEIARQNLVRLQAGIPAGTGAGNSGE